MVDQAVSSVIEEPTATAVATLFTTWFTSLADGLDHAVTDEAFAEHRAEPTALCEAVIAWAPMELAPGPRCEGCLVILRAAVAATTDAGSAVDGVGRPGLHSVAARMLAVLPIHPIRWIEENRSRVQPRRATAVQASSPTVVAHQRDHHEPPAGIDRCTGQSPVVSAGAQAGGEIALRAPISSPAPFVLDTVPVTDVQSAAQSRGAGPGVAGAGLGSPQLPAAGPSTADPEGRDSHQDVPRPRRRVLMTETPVELPLAPCKQQLDRAIASTAPTQR